MNCIIKRDIFSLFKVFTCNKCKYKAKDEFIYLGRNVIAIYHLFDNCLNLEVEKDLIVYDLDKLKILLRDATINQNEIFFCILEDFNLESYYEVFEKITDEDLSVQIITM